jgi:hypothetical protein
VSPAGYREFLGAIDQFFREEYVRSFEKCIAMPVKSLIEEICPAQSLESKEKRKISVITAKGQPESLTPIVQ